mgnify:CR=1 FL=1
MDPQIDKEILLALGRLEGKVDALITRQAVHDEELERHDSRLRKLEESKSWLLGAAAAIGGIVSLVVNYILGTKL